MEHIPAIFFYLLSIFVMFLLSMQNKITGIYKICFLFLALGQFIGVFVRCLLIISGTDLAFGPYGNYEPDSGLINRSINYMAVFNYTFIAGALFILFPKHVVTRKTKTTNNVPDTTVENLEYRNVKKIYNVLLWLSVPGIIITLLSTVKGNLIANAQLEDSRIDVSGAGPTILLMELPFVNLLLWYTLQKGKVGYLWWTALLVLLAGSLFIGNRTKMIMLFITILGILIQQKGYKTLLKRVPQVATLGVIIIYIGWIIFYVRGQLLKHGGSFLYWAKKAVMMPPIDIFNELYRKSLNGFDGFMSVISYIPSSMEYQKGQFWFESITIIIPRIIWSTKWSLPITNMFTFEIWGWSKGGIFVTGPGVFYLDSGFIGIAIGGFVFGVVSIAMLMILGRILRNNIWIHTYCIACMSYLLCRFSFAGGSNDIVFFQRLIIETLVVAFVLHWMGLTTKGVSKKTVNLQEGTEKTSWEEQQQLGRQRAGSV